MGGQEQQPLHQREIATQRAGGEIKDLHRTARPPLTLYEKCFQTLWGQAEGQPLQDTV